MAASKKHTIEPAAPATDKKKALETAMAQIERTYGKGIGQTAIGFGDGSGFVFTVFYYDPPTSPNYHGVGIAPDSAVALPEAAEQKNIYKLTYEEDTQLQAAVGALTSAQP